jgi:hypothetical protein
MKTKSIWAFVIIYGIPLCPGRHGPDPAGQVHGESAERGRVFRVQRIGGYETWEDAAASQTDDGLKVILGNSVMINA